MLTNEKFSVVGETMMDSGMRNISSSPISSSPVGGRACAILVVACIAFVFMASLCINFIAIYDCVI